MKLINEQFKKCRYIFVQNKILIPILLTLIITAVVVGFGFGSEIQKIKIDQKILMEIKISIDTLLIRTQ